MAMKCCNGFILFRLALVWPCYFMFFDMKFHETNRLRTHEEIHFENHTKHGKYNSIRLNVFRYKFILNNRFSNSNSIYDDDESQFSTRIFWEWIDSVFELWEFLCIGIYLFFELMHQNSCQSRQSYAWQYHTTSQTHNMCSTRAHSQTYKIFGWIDWLIALFCSVVAAIFTLPFKFKCIETMIACIVLCTQQYLYILWDTIESTLFAIKTSIYQISHQIALCIVYRLHLDERRWWQKSAGLVWMTIESSGICYELATTFKKIDLAEQNQLYQGTAKSFEK